jgi:hypothetical protein
VVGPGLLHSRINLVSRICFQKFYINSFPPSSTRSLPHQLDLSSTRSLINSVPHQLVPSSTHSRQLIPVNSFPSTNSLINLFSHLKVAVCTKGEKICMNCSIYIKKGIACKRCVRACSPEKGNFYFEKSRTIFFVPPQSSLASAINLFILNNGRKIKFTKSIVKTTGHLHFTTQLYGRMCQVTTLKN